MISWRQRVILFLFRRWIVVEYGIMRATVGRVIRERFINQSTLDEESRASTASLWQTNTDSAGPTLGRARRSCSWHFVNFHQRHARGVAHAGHLRRVGAGRQGQQKHGIIAACDERKRPD